MKRLSPQELETLAVKLSANTQAFKGNLIFAGKYVPVLRVEAPGQSPFLFVDTNQDGAFSEAERVEFKSVADDPEILAAATILMPLPGKHFQGFPIKIVDPNPKKLPAATGDYRSLWFRFGATVRGDVTIDGRKVLVEYTVNQKTGEIDPDYGQLSVDTDGNGSIDFSPFSIETTVTRHERAVFRVGQAYVSTKSIDLASGKIVMESHPAADYRRFELKEGAALPDFTFTDLDGKQRRFSDFRGKYVLIDFWATWCGPCVGEIPNLKEAYSRYRDRGFEVLALSGDQSSDVVRKFVKDREITWTQATVESTTDIIKHRFRISFWPTTILVDRDGKIVSFGQKYPLRGEDLARTLDGLFVKQGNSTSVK